MASKSTFESKHSPWRAPALTFSASVIPHSPVHRVFQRVLAEGRAGRTIVPLHIAEPVEQPAPAVVQAMLSYAAGKFSYSDVQGHLSFREAICQKLLRVNGIKADPDRVFVCPGSTQGMLSLHRLLAAPGAELLLAEAHWPLHLQQALLAGLTPRTFRLGPHWELQAEAIADIATPNTRALLLNTPSNPTGSVFARQALLEVLELARRNNWIVISDEAYEDFVYNGSHVSIGALEADVPEPERCVFSFYSFSKGHGLGSCRLGYAVAPSLAWAQAYLPVQEVSLMVPPAWIQSAGHAALAAQSFTDALSKQVQRNRDELLPALLDANLLADLPSGGWYVLLDLRRFGIRGNDLAEALMVHQGIAVVPGAGFCRRPKVKDGQVVGFDETSAEHTIRIAFSGRYDDLKTGIMGILEHLHSPTESERRYDHHP